MVAAQPANKIGVLRQYLSVGLGAAWTTAQRPAVRRTSSGSTGCNSLCQICSRDEAEREIAATRKPGVSYIAIGEASYPHRPQMIDDAPPLVAVRGHTEALAMPLVAVVGSRNAFAAGA
jgi:predicted Rossmann fold nucleotide-binding protein DprA/Smf involved in DNA uptake